jgi:two-component system, NarL family, sensor histidine kinase DesK
MVMPKELPAAGANDAAWVADQQRWAKGWRRVVFPYIFLAWLIQVAVAIPKDSHGAGLVAGYVVLGMFCVCYVFTVPAGWRQDDRRYRVLVASLCTLFVAELPFAHADTFIMSVFVSAVAVIKYGERALLIPGVLTALAIFLPPAVHSWHDTVGTGFSNGTAIAIPLTGLAMFGFGRVIYGNRALADARSELTRLAAENERTRIARDLHDLLGHSLTTITVKAELANRLARHDVDGAIREIGEVAALSRRALGDVRAAVSNYREVTLAGELASGRELLRAAGIVAELPPAVDVVDESTQELFGWVLREGLTNVVRHSHAHSCTVHISPSSVEISDDGAGTAAGCGNGLTGLAERVALAGGTVEAGPTSPRGWRLIVRLAADASA